MNVRAYFLKYSLGGSAVYELSESVELMVTVCCCCCSCCCCRRRVSARGAKDRFRASVGQSKCCCVLDGSCREVDGTITAPVGLRGRAVTMSIASGGDLRGGVVSSSTAPGEDLLFRRLWALSSLDLYKANRSFSLCEWIICSWWSETRQR